MVNRPVGADKPASGRWERGKGVRTPWWERRNVRRVGRTSRAGRTEQAAPDGPGPTGPSRSGRPGAGRALRRRPECDRPGHAVLR